MEKKFKHKLFKFVASLSLIVGLNSCKSCERNVEPVKNPQFGQGYYVKYYQTVSSVGISKGIVTFQKDTDTSGTFSSISWGDGKYSKDQSFNYLKLYPEFPSYAGFDVLNMKISETSTDNTYSSFDGIGLQNEHYTFELNPKP